MVRAAWRRRWGAPVGAVGAVLVNALAWSHAWRMAHYAAWASTPATIEAWSPAEKARPAPVSRIALTS